jgi:protein-L-isoaspartate(D-aspartate) O-methyltransferase
MNFEQARYNMIEKQIRTWEVLDQETLELLARIHREDFIPNDYKNLALADINIPLAHNQVTMTPKVEARLMQGLNIGKTEKILEIGTGCGYMTALLAARGNTVHSVDIFEDFPIQAQPRFAKYGLDNIHLYTGDAINGWPEAAPYDVIAVTGSVPILDASFQLQLHINGRLFVIVGKPPVMEARIITRLGEAEFLSESLFETDLPALIGVPTGPVFKF